MSTVWPSKAHTYQWDVHRRPHPCCCYGSQSRRPRESCCFQAATGLSPEPKPEARRAPRTRGQASCLPGRWLPRAPPTMWQPHPEDPTPPRAWKNRYTYGLLTISMMKFHLLKYSFYVESQLNDHCKGRTGNARESSTKVCIKMGSDSKAKLNFM